LEALQGRPVPVETGEQLRVDRVGRHDPVDVSRFAAVRRELRRLGAVHLPERPGRGVAERQPLLGHRLEQPTPHDLEALLGRRRTPRGLHPADDVAQPGQRFAASDPADLGLRSDAAAVVFGRRRRWDGHHHECTRNGPGRLGQRLSEAEVGVEAAARQVLGSEQLTGVGHPLVD